MPQLSFVPGPRLVSHLRVKADLPARKPSALPPRPPALIANRKAKCRACPEFVEVDNVSGEFVERCMSKYCGGCLKDWHRAQPWDRFQWCPIGKW